MFEKKTYRPTKAVADNIQRGIVLRDKYKRDSAVASNSVAKVNKAKDTLVLDHEGNLSFEAVKCIYNELTRLEKSVDFVARHSDGGPNDALITWYSFGGNAGLAWSRSVLKKEGILKSYTKEITKEDTEAVSDDLISKIQVCKATNEELKQVTFVCMVPNEVDLHGDITSEDEVRKACHNFNKFSLKANLFHLVETKSFEFAESYIAPVDMLIGDKFVCKGTWLCTIQCLDDDLWELIKSGEINGVSIGALASVENIEE